MKILLKLRFDGTGYHGWQKQNNALSVFDAVLSTCINLLNDNIKLTGCSRTDSGVHATYYCATLETEKCNIPIESIPEVLNNHFPDDIRCFGADVVPDDFHPRYSALSKEYKYIVHNEDYPSPFLKNRAYYHKGEVNVDLLNGACEVLKGKHDFSAFMKKDKSNPEDTVRTLLDARVERNGKLIVFTFRADGFLYNMVRILTGTLLEINSGKISLLDIEKLFENHNRSCAGKTLPPYALYLTDVEYAVYKEIK